MADSTPGDDGRVYLVRADAEHFERTVRSPVDLEAHDDRPAALADRAEARLWGAGGGDRVADHFEAMAPGDVVLFYRDGRYVGVGRVGVTFEDADGWAAEAFWDDDVPHVFTVTEFEAVDVDRAAVNRIFDYSPTYAPPDLIRVADDRVTNSLEAIELAVRRYNERRAQSA